MAFDPTKRFLLGDFVNLKTNERVDVYFNPKTNKLSTELGGALPKGNIRIRLIASFGDKTMTRTQAIATGKRIAKGEIKPLDLRQVGRREASPPRGPVGSPAQRGAAPALPPKPARRAQRRPLPPVPAAAPRRPAFQRDQLTRKQQLKKAGQRQPRGRDVMEAGTYRQPTYVTRGGVVKSRVARQAPKGSRGRGLKNYEANDLETFQLRPGEDMPVGERLDVGTFVERRPGGDNALYALPVIETEWRSKKTGRVTTRTNKAGKGRRLSVRSGRAPLSARVRMADGKTYTVRQLMAMSRTNFNDLAGGDVDFGPPARGDDAAGPRVRNQVSTYNKSTLQDLAKFYDAKVQRMDLTPRQVRYDLLHKMRDDRVITNKNDPAVHLWKNNPLRWDVLGVDAPPPVNPTHAEFAFYEGGQRRKAQVNRENALWFADHLPTVDRLEKLTKAKLVGLAKGLGIPGYSKFNKAELIERLARVKATIGGGKSRTGGDILRYAAPKQRLRAGQGRGRGKAKGKGKGKGKAKAKGRAGNPDRLAAWRRLNDEARARNLIGPKDRAKLVDLQAMLGAAPQRPAKAAAPQRPAKRVKVKRD